jgi:hypothetical protein
MTSRRNHRALLLFLLCFVAGSWLSSAQAQTMSWKEFRLQGDLMIIKLSKTLSRQALDSFVQQYRLNNLGLHSLVFYRKDDSLVKAGWISSATADSPFYLFTKKLGKSINLKRPADPIVYSRVPTPENWRKIGGNRIVYGVNRFKNEGFPIKGDTVFFSLPGFQQASEVRLAGSFTNWQHSAFSMTKTGEGWMAAVRLEPGQYFYKFIIDGKWITDPENRLRENDGYGNINSVFFVPNKTITLSGYPDAHEVYLTGSFNNWAASDLPMQNKKGIWSLDLFLQPGTYHYHFIVDGRIVEPNERKQGKQTSSTIALGKPTTFFLPGFAGANRVYLAGEFNEWKEDEIALKKVEGGWEVPYVLGPGNYQYKFIIDGKWLLDPANPNVMNDGKGNENSYLVVEPNYTFRLKGYANAKQVNLAGEFNNWSPNGLAMKRVNNEWVCSVYLGRGKHLYKFVVDGHWIKDPKNPLWEDGDENSVLWIE